MTTFIAYILSRGFLLCATILVLMPIGGLSQRAGTLNFQFLCYKNPGDLDNFGNACDALEYSHCDPYFVICISNRRINGLSKSSCPVLYYRSKTFYNEWLVCNQPTDNRGELRSFKDIDLPHPLQELYYVRIEVKDDSQLSKHKVIAIFYSTVRSNPTPNLGAFKHEEVYLSRIGRKLRNPKARMKISAAFKCDSNLYGGRCATFCRSKKSDGFKCSEKGEKICKPGWKGPDCLRNNLCKNFRCAKGAFCVLINNLPKCTCNGIIGSECYPNYNPCRPNPCKNGGRCVREQGLSGGISCLCKRFYHGSRCLEKFNLCDIEPCQNNGTCIVSEKGTRTCKCSSRFKGAVCDSSNISQISPTPNTTINAYELKKRQTRIILFVLIPLFLIPLCVLVVCMIRCLVGVWCRTRDNVNDTNVISQSSLESKPSTRSVVYRKEKSSESSDDEYTPMVNMYGGPRDPPHNPHIPHIPNAPNAPPMPPRTNTNINIQINPLEYRGAGICINVNQN